MLHETPLAQFFRLWDALDPDDLLCALIDLTTPAQRRALVGIEDTAHDKSLTLRFLLGELVQPTHHLWVGRVVEQRVLWYGQAGPIIDYLVETPQRTRLWKAEADLEPLETPTHEET